MKEARMKVLFIGDIVGEPGRKAIRKIVPLLKQKKNIDFVVANGENAAGGSGITPSIFSELIRAGVDVVTSGDHIFKRREVLEIVETQERLIRPANYPQDVPGRGFTVVETADRRLSVGVINLAGRVFMSPLDCPFRVGRKAIEEIKTRTDIVLIDVHAEATSEKVALGWYFNGLASAVVGTHTHIQTADERILPGPDHTAYLTDLGMTGPIDSVIGRKTEQVMIRFLRQVPTRFEVAEGNVQLQGAVVEIDEKSGKAVSITRVRENLADYDVRLD